MASALPFSSWWIVSLLSGAADATPGSSASRSPATETLAQELKTVADVTYRALASGEFAFDQLVDDLLAERAFSRLVHLVNALNASDGGAAFQLCFDLVGPVARRNLIDTARLLDALKLGTPERDRKSAARVDWEEMIETLSATAPFELSGAYVDATRGLLAAMAMFGVSEAFADATTEDRARIQRMTDDLSVQMLGWMRSFLRVVSSFPVLASSRDAFAELGVELLPLGHFERVALVSPLVMSRAIPTLDELELVDG